MSICSFVWMMIILEVCTSSSPTVHIVSFIDNIFDNSQLVYALSLGNSIRDHESNKINTNDVKYAIETILFIDEVNSLRFIQSVNKNCSETDSSKSEYNQLFNIEYEKYKFYLNKFWNLIITFNDSVIDEDKHGFSITEEMTCVMGENIIANEVCNRENIIEVGNIKQYIKGSNIFELYNPLMWQKMGLRLQSSPIDTSGSIDEDAISKDMKGCDDSKENLFGSDKVHSYVYVVYIELTQLILKPFISDLFQFHIAPIFPLQEEKHPYSEHLGHNKSYPDFLLWAPPSIIPPDQLDSNFVVIGLHKDMIDDSYVQLKSCPSGHNLQCRHDRSHYIYSQLRATAEVLQRMQVLASKDEQSLNHMAVHEVIRSVVCDEPNQWQYEIYAVHNTTLNSVCYRLPWVLSISNPHFDSLNTVNVISNRPESYAVQLSNPTGYTCDHHCGASVPELLFKLSVFWDSIYENKSDSSLGVHGAVNRVYGEMQLHTRLLSEWIGLMSMCVGAIDRSIAHVKSLRGNAMDTTVPIVWIWQLQVQILHCRQQRLCVDKIDDLKRMGTIDIEKLTMRVLALAKQNMIQSSASQDSAVHGLFRKNMRMCLDALMEFHSSMGSKSMAEGWFSTKERRVPGYTILNKMRYIL